MSSANAEEGSEAGSNAGATPRPGRKQRRSTISGQSTDTTTRDSESQDVSVGLVLPFLARISKGRLNVSEASIPAAARSSDISAQGQVFTPTHEHSKKLGTEVGQGHSEERSPTADSERSGQSDKTISNAATTSENAMAITGTENEIPAPPGSTSETEPGDTDTARTPPNLTSGPDAPDQAANTSPEVVSLEPLDIPQIRVHRPSGTIMAPSFETSAVDSVDVPPTPLPTPASPAEATRTLSGPIENVTAAVPLPSTGQLGPSTDTSATLGNDPANTGSVIPGQADDGTPPKAKKGRRRKRAVREARKIVVRKSFLRIILGRKLGDDVHRRLNQANSSVAASPQPLDGANDFPSAYSVRDERRRDARERQLERRIAIAKAHAQVEGLEKCPSCRGATSTTCLQRFYRLNVERDRPDMSIAERHAAAQAKAAAVKCHYPKEWMEAAGSGSVRCA